MTLLTVLAVAAGALLLLLVIWDVFSTVLHPWEKTGPLAERVIHGTWWLGMRVSSRLAPARRHALLAYVGPALIPLIVGLWALLIVTGFALVYLPFMAESFVRWEGRFDPTTTPQAFSEALFFSGYTFFTLGYGDMVPTTTGLRVLAIAQSGSGFAFITFVISYFLAVYDAYGRKNALAESVHHQAGGSGDPLRHVVSHLATPSERAGLERSLASIRDALVRLRSAYANYPILLYMRDRKPEQSLLRTLYVVREVGAILDCHLDREACPALAGFGERSGLSGAARAVEETLCDQLLRQVPEELDEEDALDETVSRDFGRIRESLGRLGIATRERGVSLADYRRHQRAWRPRLRAVAEALGEDWTVVVPPGVGSVAERTGGE